MRPDPGGSAWMMLAVALACASCQPRRPAERAPVSLPVSVFADTGRMRRLTVRAPARADRVSPDGLAGAAPPGARVWLARVAPTRARAAEPALPQPLPDTLTVAPAAPPPLAVEGDLKPPIARGVARLTLPRGVRAGSVELDVRVDERGDVSDALWAAGSEDSSLVRAAIECALAMRFFPALRGDRAVAVWCRQRYDFSPRP